MTDAEAVDLQAKLARLDYEVLRTRARTKGVDFYKLAVSEALGVPITSVTSTQRMYAKNVFFAFAYGSRPVGPGDELCATCDMSRDEHNEYLMKPGHRFVGSGRFEPRKLLG